MSNTSALASKYTRLIPAGLMALRARVPAPWLKAEVEAGRLPALRAGSRLLFDPEIVIPLLEERARERLSTGDDAQDRQRRAGGRSE